MAIPMESVSSICLEKNQTDKKIVFNADNRSVYVSLPVFFNCPLLKIHNGVMLKSGNQGSDIAENGIILLSTEVESGQDIPDEKIHAPPKIFSPSLFSSVFKGMFFLSGVQENLILLFNPEQFIRIIKKETAS